MLPLPFHTLVGVPRGPTQRRLLPPQRCGRGSQLYRRGLSPFFLPHSASAGYGSPCGIQ